jgi:ubiquinone/menaquinone biosynthesis C-methylase UbiE
MVGPGALLVIALRPASRLRNRVLAGGLLVALWTAVYARYRRWARAQTQHEFELLQTANWEAFVRHYNERVPTIEEEFELWGPFHQHRHEMRYDIVANAVREHTPDGGTILDIGCGAGLVADRLGDIGATYVGVDLPAHHIKYAADKFAAKGDKLRALFVRGDGERLPLTDHTVDVVVFTEVIEHLLQPELAVWEIARVLRPGGVLVMTTNNASEMPLRSPLTHLFAWVEKALGFHRPDLISLRPWVWPEAVHESLLPPGSDPVFLPHTHHIQGQTRAMFGAAGLQTFHAGSFEFPPPQAATVAWLDKRGPRGREAVDLIETAAQRTPFVRRLGCHLFMLARKTHDPAGTPPKGVWPGPFSA